AVVEPGLLGRKARFVAGRASHFAGHEHRSLEQETGLFLFDHLEPGLNESPATGAGDLPGVATRYRYPAPAPEMRVNKNGEVNRPEPADQPVEASGVVKMAVTADDHLDHRGVYVKTAHVLADTVRTGARVEEDVVQVSVLGDRHQHRETMLG